MSIQTDTRFQPDVQSDVQSHWDQLTSTNEKSGN